MELFCEFVNSTFWAVIVMVAIWALKDPDICKGQHTVDLALFETENSTSDQPIRHLSMCVRSLKKFLIVFCILKALTRSLK